jgi:hypothetical protein
MFPQLVVLGIVEADQVCQAVIAATKPTPGPASRSQTLTELGIQNAGMVALFTLLVKAVRVRNCTLDPNSLAGLTCGSTYGAMVDLVANASRP